MSNHQSVSKVTKVKQTRLGFRFALPEIDDLTDTKQPKDLYHYMIGTIRQLSKIGMCSPEERNEILEPFYSYQNYYATLEDSKLRVPHFHLLTPSDITAIRSVIANSDTWKKYEGSKLIPGVQNEAFLRSLQQSEDSTPPVHKSRRMQFDGLAAVLTGVTNTIFTLSDIMDPKVFTVMDKNDRRLVDGLIKKLETEYYPYIRRKSSESTQTDDDSKIPKTRIYQYKRYSGQNHLRSLLSYLGRKIESNARFISQKEWREVFELFTEVEQEAISNGKSFDIEKANNTYMSACLNMSHKQKKKFREDMNELMGMAFDLLKTK